MPYCSACGASTRGDKRFCTACGRPRAQARGARHGAVRVPSFATTALVCGLLLPGAGQAYNRRPWRGAAVLLLSPLILPWLVGAVTARQHAAATAQGGSTRPAGGLPWVLLHLWLMLDVALAILIGLTMAGVLK